MNIKTKIDRARVKIEKLEQEILTLQRECPHTNASKKGCSDTGNWCKGDDSYWWEFRCPDCGKYWVEDQ